jgi:hypothetical protein
MSSHNDEVRGRELAISWELDLDYLTIARSARGSVSSCS